MGLQQHREQGQGRSLNFAVVTVSDTRRGDQDTGGAYLVEALEAAGHRVVQRAWVSDDGAQILEQARACVQQEEVQVVLFTGGTGLALRDVTADVLGEFFDSSIPGFGELFRQLSYQEIGPATILSRACAGVSARKLVCALPGSPKALRLAMEKILLPECGHIVAQLQG
ncbi:MAG: molybdenum cofactor biosynthesis protein MoaB [Planctomycetes bacterium]|nr:molybdenum cofactor biosynthesis protein MoaB [Planctomycetota bacterium]